MKSGTTDFVVNKAISRFVSFAVSIIKNNNRMLYKYPKSNAFIS